MSLKGKRVAIVTGAKGGIGGATAEKLASDGFITVGISRSTTNGEGAAHCDVRDEQAVASVIDSVVDQHGRIDVLINCAGVVFAQDDPLDVSDDEWRVVLDTNLLGTYYCSKHAIRHMRRNEYGRIVNIASVAARQYSKTASLAYTCSKYGVVGLTRQMAAAFAKDGININCVAPSQTLSEMLSTNVTTEHLELLAAENPKGRLANPQEVATTICFLASEEASYINGAVLDVNGGRR